MPGNSSPPSLPSVPLVPCPLWGSACKVEEVTGIKPTQLRNLVVQGWCRKRKMGDTAQAEALYSLLDIIEFMEGAEPYPSPARTGGPQPCPSRSPVLGDVLARGAPSQGDVPS
jgi:hypothetical protein